MHNTSRTNQYGTQTSEGFVPHLPHKSIFLPVILDINNNSVRSAITTPQPPLRINDRLCFALPGGGIIQSLLTETES